MPVKQGEGGERRSSLLHVMTGRRKEEKKKRGVL